jgi:serine protein kinase
MSRLRKHENSTLFAKMRVHDGESLKESDPKARIVQEYKDPAGVDEGMDNRRFRTTIGQNARLWLILCTRWSR